MITIFRESNIWSYASVFALCLAPSLSYAQTEYDDGLKEIVVTGIRASIDKSISVKRNADSIVDAISSEDIGQFPDTNIAESVQRISGVQINRERGEGRTVNIRGLPANFTLTTLNGRTLPNAFSFSSARSFDFAILPSEFVRTLEVLKSPTADVDDGGLSGVVNVRTPRALDIGKRSIAASFEEQYEGNSGKWAPKASLFYSNVFADGRLGISLGGSYTARRNETHSIATAYTTSTEQAGISASSGPVDLNGDGVITPDRVVRIPNFTTHQIQPEKRDRISLIGSIGFVASDSLSFNIDGFYTKVSIKAPLTQSYSYFAYSSGAKINEVQMIDGLETVTDMTVDNLDLRNGARLQDRSGDILSGVASAKYEKDGWLLQLEGSRSKSTQKYSDLNIAVITNGAANFHSVPGQTIPYVAFLNGFDSGRFDPANHRIASLNGPFDRRATDDLWDVKFDAVREINGGFLKSVRFGAKYVDRKQYSDNKWLTVLPAGVSKLYGGLPAGPVPGSVGAAPLMTLIESGAGAFLDSYSGDRIFPTSWLRSNVNKVIDGHSNDELRAAGIFTNDASGIIDVQEKTLAFYARADFGAGNFSGNIGLRGVRTQSISTGASPDLTTIIVDAEAGSGARVPAAQPVTINRKYWDFLPSLNIKYQATDDLVLRFSASRTMARPNLIDISPSVNVDGFYRTITANNPELNPYRSTNLDLTGEWYFKRDALVGVSVFYKNIESLIVRNTVVKAIPINYFYASTGNIVVSDTNYSLSNLINGSGVKVKGIEFYYQQQLSFLPAPFDGLGTIFNYTLIDNSDPRRLTAASRHNFNVTGYYEKGPIGVRLSYSWRDSYLSNTVAYPGLDEKALAYGTLDGSMNIKLSKNASIVVQAVNILNSAQISKYTSGLPYSFTDAGRKISIGGRVSF